MSCGCFYVGNLFEESKNCAETTIEDVFIRKFIHGTWHGLFASELIIKRRQNAIILAGLVYQNVAPSKMYFLQGYTEELLAHLLRRPVRMEIQTVNDRRDVYFKWI
jgi:small subunit ribosomal protein S24